MAIRPQGVAAVTVADLLSAPIRIPAYQRPYSWAPSTAQQLYEDLREAWSEQGDHGSPYVLGAVIFHQHDGAQLDLVDGQQRLLTLRMLTSLLGHHPLALDEDTDSPVARVWRALRTSVSHLGQEDRAGLLDFVLHRCELVQVVTDSADEAFRVFDSQNYRGKPLAPHDLLKAHHLRAMGAEPEVMKRAVVDRWESATDDDLHRLFSVYLYRIIRWSRGERAGTFTAQDVDELKGIDPGRVTTPSARYHVTAQGMVPLLEHWQVLDPDGDARQLGRARFQIDMPLVAGRAFFEMTSFMLEELRSLRQGAYGESQEPFASCDPDLREIPARARYRKVSELYLATLLYLTNRFGDLTPEARARVFAWAYAPRLELRRVQHASVDKHASGEGGIGLFTRIRHARSVTEAIRRAEGPSAPREGHEVELRRILAEGRAG